MHLAVTCPQCGRTQRIDEKDALESIPCSNCSQPLSLRSTDTFPELSIQLPEEEPPADDTLLSPLQPGDVLADIYEVEAVLGEGKLGRVYKVLHRDWGIDLVLKSVWPHLQSNTRVRQAIVRESEKWVGLGIATHLAGCYYARELEDALYVFVEYVSGATVSGAVRDRRLYRHGPERALERILDIAIQSAWGIHFLHEQGELHQDIHPSNILVSPDATVKLTDPGLLRALWSAGKQFRGADLEEPSALPGPSPYAAPEQGKALAQDLQENPYEHKIRITRQSDIWSWAMCVLEMLGGRFPPEADAPTSKLLRSCARLAAADDTLPSIPDELSFLLERCLALDPVERPRDLGEVADTLARIYQAVNSKAYSRTRHIGPEIVADGLNNRALARMDLGQREQAEALLERALLAAPIHLQANYNLGMMHWRSGKLTDDELIRKMRRVRSECQDTWQDEYLLSWIHLERGDGDTALGLIREARKQAGDDYAAREELDHLEAKVTPGSRCAHKLSGHDGDILGVDLTPDGAALLSTGADASIRVWDTENGSCRQILWEDSPVGGAAISPDASTAISFTRDSRSLQVWEVQSGQRIRLLRGHSSLVRSVALSQDGASALSADEDGTLRVWEVLSGQCDRTMSGHDGSILDIAWTSTVNRAVTAGQDGTLRVWDVVSGQPVTVIKDKNGPIRCVAVSADGRLAISGGSERTVQLWDIETARSAGELRGHTAAIKGVALEANGHRAVTISRDDTLRLWDVDARRCLRTIGAFGASRLASTPACELAVTAHYGEVRVWRLEPLVHRAPVAVVPPRKNPEALVHEKAFRDATMRAEYARECEYWGTVIKELAAARAVPGYDRAEKALAMWAEASHVLRRGGLRDIWVTRDFKQHAFEIREVGVTPDGRCALSMDNGGVVHAWQTRGGDLSWSRNDLMRGAGLSIAASGRRLLCATRDGALRLRSIETGHTEEVLGGLRERMTAVAVNVSGEVLAYACGEDIAPMIRIVKVGARHFMHQLQGHSGQITALALSADGRTALTSSRDKTARVWDLYTGRRVGLLEGHLAALTAAALTPDGRTAVTGDQNGALRVWDLQANESVWDLTADEQSVHDVAVTPDGRLAVSGGATGTICLWDLKTGKCIRTLSGHLEGVSSVALSWNARTLVSAGNDRIVRAWHLDWDLKEPEIVDWDDEARPWLRVFLACHTPLGSYDRPGLATPKWADEDLKAARRLLEWGGFGWLRDDSLTRALKELTEAVSRRIQGAANRQKQARRAFFKAREAMERSDWMGASSQLVAVRSMPEYERSKELLEMWAKVSRHTCCGKFRQAWEHRRMVARSMYDVALGHDGRVALTGGFDGEMMLWDVVHGRALERLVLPFAGGGANIAAVYLSPSSRWAVAAGDQGELAIWEVPGGTLRYKQQVDIGKVTAACFATGGRVAILGTHEGIIHLIDVSNGRQLRTFGRQDVPIEAIAAVPNSRIVAAASADHQIQVWDTRSSRCISSWRGHEAMVTGLAVSGDGAVILTTGLDKRLCVWQKRDGKQLRVLEGHRDAVRGVAVTSDVRTAVTASSDHTLRIWDLKKGEFLHEIGGSEGHTSRVRAVSITPDGRFVASISSDGTSRVWYLDWEREGADETLNLWYRY